MSRRFYGQKNYGGEENTNRQSNNKDDRTEPRTFPPNRNLYLEPGVFGKDCKLVSINRMLFNAWRNDFQVIDDNTCTLEENYLDEQREMIVSLTGKEYYPPELFLRSLPKPGTKRFGETFVHTTGQKLKEMEEKEKVNEDEERKMHNDGDSKGEPHFEAAGEVQYEVFDDFGGEDYAHDYYADEEVDANQEADNDGGIF